MRLRFLTRLAGMSDDITADAFLRHASAALSVALQSGNSDVASRGTQAQRCQQLQLGSDDTVAMSTQPRAASRRRQARHHAELLRTPVTIGGYHSAYHATAPPKRYSALIAHSHPHSTHPHAPHPFPHSHLSPEQGELPLMTAASRAMAGRAA